MESVQRQLNTVDRQVPSIACDVSIILVGLPVVMPLRAEQLHELHASLAKHPEYDQEYEVVLWEVK